MFIYRFLEATSGGGEKKIKCWLLDNKGRVVCSRERRALWDLYKYFEICA
jgi:hypothetical protein